MKTWKECTLEEQRERLQSNVDIARAIFEEAKEDLERELRILNNHNERTENPPR